MKMNRVLVFLTMGLALSLMVFANVNASMNVKQGFFLCNQGNWNQASNPGDLQINVCTANGNQGNVVFDVRFNGLSVASGGCNFGPCSDPTAVGVQDDSYLILRFSPSSIYGMQVMEPDSTGSLQQVWVPYQYSYPASCNPYSQFCFASQSQNNCGNYQSNSCSAVIFRIVTTPITINVFFSQPT